ncbi:ATP-dependent helicase HrpB [Paenibacillus sp. IB182496]|uniref:ATP-dependent helicase HrpB n=1 Tax=Paenibacillus sabuli TaxID=2772509 RepID=A0A927BTZ6_9BACL|nr:ATP-dependent helicase HrpB [Paenibacillus sabuli]MBD2846778.1 ATP-dependent helicase HrpB [Paenibacillus sabuli]
MKSRQTVDTALPVVQCLPQLREALRQRGCAVLVAPPGAGKTTIVPLALLDEPWLEGRKLLLLEPRRLAARAAARHMAAKLGEPVGQTVGYRMRLETKVGPSTRIEVVTEGVLTRMLQADPGLEQAGAILFDEYHERSLHADLGLALALQARELLRPELRLIAMSATLEAEPVAALLGDAPVIRSEGRVYPVETIYAPPAGQERLEVSAAALLVRALHEQPQGDLLVFLPGVAELRRTAAQLQRRLEHAGASVRLLHGNLPLEEQDAALQPDPQGKRKIVLATSIAESSLTVEGVRTVVDCGWMRVSRFSPRTGMSRLETVPVSQASADQRRGRAGRVAPGACYRLWSEAGHDRLPAAGEPEIRQSDLAPLALELAQWGAADASELKWLDPPPPAALRQAGELLLRLGALDADHRITAHGRRMAELGGHPRLAHMVLRAVDAGLGPEACLLAALLGERDPLRREGGGRPEADLRLRFEALLGRIPPGHDLDPSAAARIRRTAGQWRRAGRVQAHASVAVPRDGGPKNRDGGDLLSDGGAMQQDGGAISRDASDSSDQSDPSLCGALLAHAYPDRIAQRRGTGRYVLSGGRGAALAELQALSSAPYLVVVELDDKGEESRIDLAAPLDQGRLERELADEMEQAVHVNWNRARHAVEAREQLRLGALVLRERAAHHIDADVRLGALLSGIREEGLQLLPWTRPLRQLQQRLCFMHASDPPAWPDASDEALLGELELWLGPFAAGMRSAAELQRVQLREALESRLSWQERRQLEELAPTHVQVPSGSRIPVDYGDPAAPVLAVRLQELFGLRDTPRIGGGRIALTLHLLSPAQRPMQVTRDLRSFWAEAYFEVKKDLKGRYPKHYWPDNPLEAPPTRRVKPRGS